MQSRRRHEQQRQSPRWPSSAASPRERGDLCERAARCAPSRRRPWQRGLCWLQAASDSSEPWLTRWPRVARESTVLLGDSEQGAPSTLAGRPGPPGWAARATLAGQGCPARAVRLGTASHTGSGDPAPLAGSHQPYGLVGAGQAGWRPPRLVGHIRTLAIYVRSLPTGTSSTRFFVVRQQSLDRFCKNGDRTISPRQPRASTHFSELRALERQILADAKKGLVVARPLLRSDASGK